MTYFRRTFSRKAWLLTAAGALFGFTAAAPAAIINADVTAPGDQIYGVQITANNPNSAVVSTSTGTGGTNSYPATENPPNAIDNNQNNKYLNFAGTSANTSAGNFAGFIVTPSAGSSTLTGVHFSTGNDSNDRDPLTVAIYGTNSPVPAGVAAGGTITGTYSLVYSGPSGLATDPGRNTFGPVVTFAPVTAGPFTSYELLVTSTRGDPNQGCCFQFGEVELIGNTVAAPEPTALGLVGLAGFGLLARRRRSA